MSFKERFAKLNFEGRISRGDDDFTVGSGDDELSNLKVDLYKDKNDPEYKEAFRTALGSHKDLQTLATDDSFRKHFKEVHGSDGEYEKFMEYADKSAKIKEVMDKKSKLMIEKDKQALENTQKIGDAICATMEEPGRTFYQSLFNMLMENKMNASKLRALKDDETGFDLEEDLKKASGNDNVLKDVEEKTGEKFQDEFNDETSEASAGEAQDIVCESKDDLYKLGESLGKKVHGDKYSEKIMKDCVKHALKLSDDNVNVAASMLRNWYSAANADTTNFSTVLNKFVEPTKESNMKNFSERLNALRKNFGMTEAAKPKEDINPEVPVTQEGEIASEHAEQVAEQTAQPLETQEATPTQEQTTTEAPKPGEEEQPKNFGEETQTPAETVQPTGTEATTTTVPAGETQEPAATVQPQSTEGAETTEVPPAAETQTPAATVQPQSTTTSEVTSESAEKPTTEAKPKENLESTPTEVAQFSEEVCPKCGQKDCHCKKVVLRLDEDEFEELKKEAKEFTKYPDQFANFAEQSVGFGDFLENSRLKDYVRDALFSALVQA